MASIIHHDRIVERLEMARTMGLVTNYDVSRVGSARRPDANVKVWGKPGAREDSIKEHLVRMLHGLVAQDQIVVIQPFAAESAVATAPDKAAVTAGAVPVAA
jgi:hypothetical protein